MNFDLGPVEKVRPQLRRLVWTTSDLVVRPTASLRALPDYLIIGAQRAGTTSLQRVLTAHPDVAPPRFKKGVHYFDRWFGKGPTWYRSQFQLRSRRDAHRRRTGFQRITGEASPYYIFHPAIPGRIASLVPQAKLILLVRDPVERAISHHKHEVRRGYEELSLEEALAAEPERLAGEEERLLADPTAYSFAHQHHSYVARGRYAEQVRRYLEHFDKRQLLVVESEEFWGRPLDALEEVLAFLCLRDWKPAEYPQVNATEPAAIDPSVRSRLETAFADSNADLESLLGRSFRWT